MKINIKAISYVALLTLTTNLLGFIRDIYFARIYGISGQADAYITAFSIVSSFFLLFTAGTLQSSFMPKYQALLNKDKTQAAKLACSSLFILSVTLITIYLMILTYTPQIVNAIVPGFNLEKLKITTELVKILAPSVLFMGIGSIFQSIFHANKKFFIPAFIPVLTNIILIFYLIKFASTNSITGMAYALLLGNSLWFLIGFPITFRAFKIPKINEVLSNNQKKVLVYMLPLIFLLFADQISSLVQKFLISDLGDGYISALNYAYRISSLPIGVFSMATAVVIFPTLIDAISQGNKKKAESLCYDGIELVLFFSLPVMLIFFFFGKELIQIIFQKGAFNANATNITYQGLSWYALGIIPQSLLVFYARIYYAAEDYMTPMKVGILSALLHILICSVAVKIFGFLGVAISTTLYAYIYCYFLNRNCKKIISINISSLIRIIPKPFISAIAMLVVLGVSKNIHFQIGLIQSLIFTLIIAGITYLISYLFLHRIIMKTTLNHTTFTQ